MKEEYNVGDYVYFYNRGCAQLGVVVDAQLTHFIKIENMYGLFLRRYSNVLLTNSKDLSGKILETLSPNQILLVKFNAI